MAEKKNKTNISDVGDKSRKDDISIYRILILLLIGMIGFPAIGALDNIFETTLLYLCAAGGILIAAAAVLYIYSRIFAGKNAGAKLLISFGISFGMATAGLFLVLYPFFDGASGKFQAAFIMIILLGCIYNLYTRGFFGISLAIFLCIFLLYFINIVPVTALEFILQRFSRIAVFPLTVCGMIFAAFKIFGVKIPQKIERFLPESRFYAVLSLLVWSSNIVAAACLMAFPAVYAFILAYFIVLFIVLGIICTIKLL